MEENFKNNINNINSISDSYKNNLNENITKDNDNNNDSTQKKPDNFIVHKINNNNIDGLDIKDYSDANTDLKIPVSENGDKDEDNDIYNKNNFEKKDEANSVKNNAVFDIVNNAKKFFGFDRQNSKKRDGFNRRTMSGRFMKNGKLRKSNVINFAENNCSICFQEIKEKFTLICGDFFCYGCMRESILTAIKEISNLDKLSCPICKEKIEVNTIKKLLSEEEFNKYKYFITKIEGYKNEDYIPCPYPDCPDFAPESQFETNIVICQNGHSFCKKCLDIIDKSQIETKHKCFENVPEEEQMTQEYIKKNKNIRKCPKCHNIVIREGGGCNNMTCTNIWCGYEFCWICNGKYEESHYKNPISMCFGLADSDKDKILLKYARIRLFRCILIFVLLIFVILPIVITFFSVFLGFLYILAFILDGSSMGYIKLKSKSKNKLFYKIVYCFYFCVSIAYIPFGYVALVLAILGAPVLIIYFRIKKKNEDDTD